MSVHDAQTGDIYTDEHGGVWMVIARWNEPVITAERIWPKTEEPNTATGGISGLMWQGWKRIARTMDFKD